MIPEMNPCKNRPIPEIVEYPAFMEHRGLSTLVSMIAGVLAWLIPSQAFSTLARVLIVLAAVGSVWLLQYLFQVFIASFKNLNNTGELHSWASSCREEVSSLKMTVDIIDSHSENLYLQLIAERRLTAVQSKLFRLSLPFLTPIAVKSFTITEDSEQPHVVLDNSDTAELGSQLAIIDPFSGRVSGTFIVTEVHGEYLIARLENTWNADWWSHICEKSKSGVHENHLELAVNLDLSGRYVSRPTIVEKGDQVL